MKTKQFTPHYLKPMLTEIFTYRNLAAFVNKANERIFNDRLIILAVTEIRLKSGGLNEELILPRYYAKDCVYNGERFERAGRIRDVMPAKALAELKALIVEGSKKDFKNNSQIKNWIHERTNIQQCSLSVVE